MSTPDRLRAEELRGGALIGREVIVLDRTKSTNDVVRGMTDSPEGICVFAEEQSAGRGQRGNKWESAHGKGLWFSILLRPKIEIQDAARLTIWVAEVIAQTITEELDLPATVKSPNDVYIGDRKIAGVLVEMRAQQNAPHVAIVGVGLNVNHSVTDFPEELRRRATSLAILRGELLDRNRLALAVLRNLDRTYAELFG